MHSEVVGFQPVLGDHSGWNLEWYFIGLCDHVGIYTKDQSKVCSPRSDSLSWAPTNYAVTYLEALHHDAWQCLKQ